MGLIIKESIFSDRMGLNWKSTTERYFEKLKLKIFKLNNTFYLINGSKRQSQGN